MIVVNDKQLDELSEYIPNVRNDVKSISLNDFLLNLDALITEIGFDKNWELNEIGIKLQLVYDQVYRQNKQH